MGFKRYLDCWLENCKLPRTSVDKVTKYPDIYTRVPLKRLQFVYQ